jgi:hypothetical protein
VSYTPDPRVDDYIDKLPDWQQRVCQQVRELVRDADPEVVETIKRSVQPYFVLDGNICALLATKDHVNVFLYDNKTGRTAAIYENDTINAPALTAMFRQVIANNRAGGWRKLKKPN